MDLWKEILFLAAVFFGALFMAVSVLLGSNFLFVLGAAQGLLAMGMLTIPDDEKE